MKTCIFITTFSCDMCGKKEQTEQMPARWSEYRRNKHVCPHCRRIFGTKPINLSTLEIRRCLSTMKIGGLQ